MSEPIDIQFTAAIIKTPETNDWVCVVLPRAAETFGTKGIIKIRGRIDRHEFRGSFFPVGGGGHVMRINADLRALIGKDIGDTVIIQLNERLPIRKPLMFRRKGGGISASR